MTLQSLLLVACGGALGACGRFVLSTWLFVPGQFPWPTLAINVLGSFGIGLVWGLSLQQSWFELWGRYLLVIGFLGGFTTFSAFSVEVVALIEGGRVLASLSYIVASVLACISAAWIGQLLTSDYL